MPRPAWKRFDRPRRLSSGAIRRRRDLTRSGPFAVDGRTSQPRVEPLEWPGVDDPLSGNARKTCVRECGLGIRELRRGVRVAVEREETSIDQRPAGQRVIKILSGRVSIELNRHAEVSGSVEDYVPPDAPVSRIS